MRSNNTRVYVRYVNPSTLVKFLTYIDGNNLYESIELDHLSVIMNPRQFTCLPNHLRDLDELYLGNSTKELRDIINTAEYMTEGLEYVSVRVTDYFMLYIPLILPNSISINLKYHYIVSERFVISDACCKFKNAKSLENIIALDTSTKLYEGLEMAYRLGFFTRTYGKTWKLLKEYFAKKTTV